MKPEKRAAKDAEAMAELVEWCSPLSLVIDDNGCEIRLKACGSRVASAWYRRPWLDKESRSRASACRELIKYISDGKYLRMSFERMSPAPCGGVFYDSRMYEFKIPACQSPSELAVKLAAIGWKLPQSDAVWENSRR